MLNHLSEHHTVQVGRNETNSLLIKPNVGTLSVSSEPPGAEFSLSATGRNRINEQGNVPKLIEGLPAGNYQLRVWRGDYVKEMTPAVKKWETNRINVAFEYGEVRVVSEPDGA